MNFALLQKQPWLIEPEAFAFLFEASRSFFSNQEKPADPPATSLLTIDDGVGVVGIRGPMLRRPGYLDRIFVAVEALYGFKAGLPGGIKRIVKP